jgi:hypothetical protein
MSKRGLFLILVLIILINSINVYSMGFSGSYDEITFEPGLEQDFEWQLITTSSVVRNYSINVHGDLSEYVEITSGNFLENVKPNENPYVYATLKLPEEEPSPGMHIIDITMKELPRKEEREAGIVALSGAIPRIHVNVLYEGKYIEGTMDVEDINIGEIIRPSIELKNFGKEDINNLQVEFMLYDGNEMLKSYKSEITSFESDTEKLIEGELNSEGLDGGSYTIKADVSWDNEHTFFEKEVRIGNMDIDILNYTRNLKTDKINQFDVLVESKWNGKIKDVYAEITLNGQIVKTANEDINAWQNKTLSSYINTEGMEEGNYNGQIVVYFGENQKEKDFSVMIEKEKSAIELNSTILIISGLSIIVVLLIGINIFVLIKKGDKHGKKKRKR